MCNCFNHQRLIKIKEVKVICLVIHSHLHGRLQLLSIFQRKIGERTRFSALMMRFSPVECGFRLRAAYFFLLRQKKVSKEKATPGYAVGWADFPALLDKPGVWLNSPAAQTRPDDFPRLVSVARRFT